jgi:hypothetical protein
MRKKTFLSFGLAAALFMTACTGAGSSSDTTQTEETTISTTTTEAVETTTETPVETTTEPQETLSEAEQIYQDMIDRSLINPGNNARMKRVMERARAGEDITIAYIGGSITEGYNAGTDDIYAKLSYEYFADTYGSRDTVHYVNAGLSGTPSTLGLIRSDRDVFAYESDIIFIEFAVNDGSGDARAYDSLIMKALQQDNEPAVVLLFSVIESGYTRQDDMAQNGFYYELPLISMKNAIWLEFEEGRLTWEDWSNDESHPNAFGQAAYADMIIHYFETVEASETDEPVEVPEKLYLRADLTSMEMMDIDNLTVDSLGSFAEKSGLASFTRGWVKEADQTDNEPFTFTFEGTYLYVVYKDTTNSTYGTAQVYVDGEPVATLEANSSDGWNNPVAECVYRQEEAAAHTVEIRMAEGDEDKQFAILCFGIVK